MSEEEYQKRKQMRRRQSKLGFNLELDKRTAAARNKRRKREIPKAKTKSPGCYKYITDAGDSSQLKLTDINSKHILTAYGYLRQLLKDCHIFLSIDMMNEITYFYALPMILKIGCKQHTSRTKAKVILHILYCPIDDTWHILCEKIIFHFKLTKHKYLVQHIQHTNGTCIYENDWDNIQYISNCSFDADILSAYFSPIYPQFGSLIHTCSDSDYTSSSSTDEAETMTLYQKLKQFDQIAAIGNLFIIYKSRKGKKQNRIVKVLFNSKHIKPDKLIWGSGPRFVEFENILYIAHGHWTSVFHSKDVNVPNDKLCFSVVTKDKTLDLSGENIETVELWVMGLRQLIGQSNAQADYLARQGLETAMKL
eukprot:337991_1